MPIARQEMIEIYKYIYERLYAKTAANNLLKLIENEIDRLRRFPKLYARIEKFNKINRVYRRIVIKKYILLYTIDENEKIVYIDHIFYGGRDYLNKNF